MMLEKFLLFGIRRAYRGFGFLTDKIYKQGVIAENRYGVKLRLKPYEHIDAEILYKGYYEDIILKTLLGQLKDEDTFWDVGANIGLHSLTIKKLKSKVSCFSFEPFYSNFEKLTFNRNLNPDINLNLYNFALAEDIKIVNFYTTTNNHGRSGFIQMPDADDANINILTISGNALINLGFRIPNVIKIDAEGAELSILHGYSQFLRSSDLRAIIFESWDNIDEITSFLKIYDFTISKLDTNANFLATRFT